MRKPMLGAVSILLAAAAPSAAAPLPEGTQTVRPATAGAYPYQLFVPRGYAANRGQRWPLVIFLHGSGERGSDPALVKKHGPPNRIEGRPGSPFLLVSPQLEAEGVWSPAKLDATLARVRKAYRVDPGRIYLTGLSLGGMGTWEWAMWRPRTFAAIVPVAARADPANACVLKDLPIWAFHGDADPAVPVEGDFQMVQAVRACGGAVPPRLTVYPGVGHDSWTQAYDDPALWRWLMEQRQGAPVRDEAERRTKARARR